MMRLHLPRAPLRSGLNLTQTRHKSNYERVLQPPRVRNLNALPARKPTLPERAPYRPRDPVAALPAAPLTPAGDLTFVRRPPPSAPTPFSLTTSPASPLLAAPPTTSEGAALPPPTRPPIPDRGRLSDADIEEIQRLRAENPAVWTRGALAKKFACSQAFVGMVSALKKPVRREALAVRDEEHDKQRAKWGERKRLVKEIRKRRKEFW